MPNEIITDIETTVLSCFVAAHKLGISMDRLRQISREGRIGHRRIGSRYFYSLADLATYRTGRIVPVGTVTPPKKSTK